MIEADKLADDENLIDVVFEAQGRRHARSATRGRAFTTGAFWRRVRAAASACVLLVPSVFAPRENNSC